ncbi:MAG: Sua5/YciO/YrdC/YwlC family protein, partial [Candidatus Methylomirabilales bacterium]
MPPVFELTEPEDAALEAAVQALAGGDLVVFPTDTVYGVAARPDVVGATARVFEAKRRRRGLTLP